MGISLETAGCCNNVKIVRVDQQRGCSRIGRDRSQEDSYTEASSKHREEKNNEYLPSDNAKCVCEQFRRGRLVCRNRVQAGIE